MRAPRRSTIVIVFVSCIVVAMALLTGTQDQAGLQSAPSASIAASQKVEFFKTDVVDVSGATQTKLCAQKTGDSAERPWQKIALESFDWRNWLKVPMLAAQPMGDGCNPIVLMPNLFSGYTELVVLLKVDPGPTERVVVSIKFFTEASGWTEKHLTPVRMEHTSESAWNAWQSDQ